MKRPSIEDMASFCMRKGIIYPSGDIYGGEKGFFDFGPFGTEIKRNLVNHWWNTFVQQQSDVIGLDGSIITNPKVWQASGHVDGFVDLVLESQDGTWKVRADHFLEDELGEEFEGIQPEEVDELIQKHELKDPNGNEWKPCTKFNLMFETHLGPYQTEESTGYLRPETAQMIFTNFKYAKQNGRQKLPFGIAQEGKAFRNEISPRNFLFRTREFSQLEIEWFKSPHDSFKPLTEDMLQTEVQVYTVEAQEGSGEMEQEIVKTLVDADKMNPSQAHYIVKALEWFEALGVSLEYFRIREQLDEELAHYSTTCWDIEYEFPFGWKEIMGCADRGDHDLGNHTEASGTKLTVYDQDRGEHVTPVVSAEPSLGVERAFLVFLYDALIDDDRGNDTLQLHPTLAPNTVAVFPLVKNKDELRTKAENVYKLISEEFATFYDERGSIGKRYARQDEVGTPFCITVDFDTLEDDTVTIRDRDTTEQDRVPIEDLHSEIQKRIDAY